MNLSGALVRAISSSTISGVNKTDDSGLTNITVFPGIYSIQVVWQNVIVADVNYTVSENVSMSDPVVVNAGDHLEGYNFTLETGE